MRYIILFLNCFLGMILTCNTSQNSTNIPQSKYVTVALNGQLGNQLFQIATAYAYSLDHNLPLTVPNLVHKNDKDVPYNAENFFRNRIPCYDLPSPPLYTWKEPSFNYTRIPRCDKIELFGYFTSEKYFLHRRQEIIELFDFPEGLKERILDKYPVLASDALVVGIQIRDYRKEFPAEDYHPTIKRKYYEQAMSYFPEDTIFLVSSNNAAHARECTTGIRKNIIYLHGEDYIEEFYTLVLCKSFIISNSTFGWWASWLSTAANKIVIAPNPWFNPPYNNEAMRKDLLPKDYLVIDVSE